MAECGTYAGYQQHKKKRTPTCEPCKKANADYNKQRRARGGPSVDAERRYDKAAKRARQSLIERHRDEFLQLLRGELAQKKADSHA